MAQKWHMRIHLKQPEETEPKKLGYFSAAHKSPNQMNEDHNT